MALTQKKVNSLKPRARQYVEMDGLGLGVCVLPSGNKTYQYRYRIGGQQHTLTLGDARAIKLAQAQQTHRHYVSQVKQGINPKEQLARQQHESTCLGEFIEGPYAEKLRAEGKRSDEQVAMLRANFKALWSTPINQLTDTQLRKWQNRRAAEIAISSVNRYTNAIKAVTEYARVYKVVAEDPLADLRRVKQQVQTPDIRWLNDSEEQALRRALDYRDSKLRGLDIFERPQVTREPFLRISTQLRPAKDANAIGGGDHSSL